MRVTGVPYGTRDARQAAAGDVHQLGLAVVAALAVVDAVGRVGQLVGADGRPGEAPLLGEGLALVLLLGRQRR